MAESHLLARLLFFWFVVVVLDVCDKSFFRYEVVCVLLAILHSDYSFLLLSLTFNRYI